MNTGELGNTKTYFGEVVSIQDPTKMFRCQVSIKGFTDQLVPEDHEDGAPVPDLPWYFVWYGVNHLPQVGDTVPVIIFDDVITSGFYGNPQPTGYFGSADDYANYLEIFKREIDSNIVAMQYTESEGIELVNGPASVTVTESSVELECKQSKVIVDEEGIALGEGADQYIPRGDEVTQAFQDVLDQVTDIAKLFSLTSTWYLEFSAACGANPLTANLLPPFTTLATEITTLLTNIVNLQMSLNKDKLQSSVVMSL